MLGACTTLNAAAPAPNGRAAGASTPNLTVETLAERRVSVNGSIEYASADQLKMGEEIFYTVRVRNVNNASVVDPVVIKSIPRNTRYVANSATGPASLIDFSVDGGVTFAAPEQLFVETLAGVRRPAQLEDYTTIRWRLRHPLAAGATALLRFRATFH
jgi:uncharacterized repeat protein (TIGR01451 family)